MLFLCFLSDFDDIDFYNNWAATVKQLPFMSCNIFSIIKIPPDFQASKNNGFHDNFKAL